MSFEKARTALKIADVAITGLEMIEKLTNVGGDKAEAALAGVRAAIELLKKGLAGEATPQAVLTQIETLSSDLAANDAAADAAVDAKFKR